MSINKEMLSELYLDQKMSIPDISRIMGMSRSNIRYHLLRCGVNLRSRSEAIDLARPKMGKHLKGTHKVFSEEHKRKISESRKRFYKDNAKGVNIHQGYKRLTQGANCNRLQHVVIVEQHLGRKLAKGEVVHHINGDKLDNRIENLKVMTASEHSRMHAIERQKQGKCYDISREARQGDQHPQAKLNWEIVEEIRCSDEKICELAKRHKVSWTTIKNIKLNKIWRKTNAS